MNILLIRKKAKDEEIKQMLEVLETYIKVAVDVEKGMLAGGGMVHADCEALLLECGSEQKDIWGADFDPASKTVTFEALINIRPWQNNRKMSIESEIIREKVEKIIRDFLER